MASSRVSKKRSEDGTLYRCPCCGCHTLEERGGDEICQVCFWHDDGQDDPDADEVWGGPNYELSLTQARKNYMSLLQSTWSNERASGKGGIPSLLHVGRARPALPEHER
jgi:hypothetical protein